MNINDILAEEDRLFNERNNTLSSIKKTSKKKTSKKKTSKKIKNFEELDIKNMGNDDARNAIMEQLLGTNNETQKQIVTKSGTKFNQHNLETDLRNLIYKYGIKDPSQQNAVDTIISTFIQNLYSVSLIKREY
jgi:hypothetical protein